MNKLIKSVLDKYFLFQDEKGGGLSINSCIPASMKIDISNEEEWGKMEGNKKYNFPERAKRISQLL